MTTAPTLTGQIITNLPFVTKEGESRNFKQMQGKNFVLYFYPKDNTPGCTQESKEFAELYSQFLATDTEIFGISRDNLKSHDKFRCKYDLPFQLISDADQAICHYFSVLKEKNMFGIKSMGIERSTFLIDKKGIIRQEWRKVKPQGHAAEVLAAVNKLGQ